MARSLTAGMLQRSDRTILIAAIVLALLAGTLVFIAVNSSGSSKAQPSADAGAGTVAVVTAAQDIPANTKLSADMLTLTTVPTASALVGSFTSSDLLVGSVTRYPIQSGEQLTVSKIGTDVKDDKSVSLVVPDGMRGISVPVAEENIVGGLLLPGDMVDVLVVYKGQDNIISTVENIAQNVQVLAVAQSVEKPISRPSGTTVPGAPLGQVPSDANAQPDANTVTLSVTPDQAMLMAAVGNAENAKVWLDIRARGDNSTLVEPPLILSQATPTPAPGQ